METVGRHLWRGMLEIRPYIQKSIVVFWSLLCSRTMSRLCPILNKTDIFSNSLFSTHSELIVSLFEKPVLVQSRDFLCLSFIGFERIDSVPVAMSKCCCSTKSVSIPFRRVLRKNPNAFKHHLLFHDAVCSLVIADRAGKAFMTRTAWNSPNPLWHSEALLCSRTMSRLCPVLKTDMFLCSRFLVHSKLVMSFSENLSLCNLSLCKLVYMNRWCSGGDFPHMKPNLFKPCLPCRVASRSCGMTITAWNSSNPSWSSDRCYVPEQCRAYVLY